MGGSVRFVLILMQRLMAGYNPNYWIMMNPARSIVTMN